MCANNVKLTLFESLCMHELATYRNFSVTTVFTNIDHVVRNVWKSLVVYDMTVCLVLFLSSPCEVIVHSINVETCSRILQWCIADDEWSALYTPRSLYVERRIVLDHML